MYVAMQIGMQVRMQDAGRNACGDAGSDVRCRRGYRQWCKMQAGMQDAGRMQLGMQDAGRGASRMQVGMQAGGCGMQAGCRQDAGGIWDVGCRQECRTQGGGKQECRQDASRNVGCRHDTGRHVGCRQDASGMQGAGGMQDGRRMQAGRRQHRASAFRECCICWAKEELRERKRQQDCFVWIDSWTGGRCVGKQ